MPDSPAASSALTTIIDRYKADPESVYNTWFIGGEARMKAFRSIRRGVKEAVDAIATSKFGNDFKGSPLEVVLAAITEQKQVFEGAAHPFYWKPKLRIPDIYENESNKRAFGNFLNACLNASREEQVLSEMSRLADARPWQRQRAAATAPRRTQKRRATAATSALSMASAGIRGSSVMPQIGQKPGSLRTICWCIGQVHSVAWTWGAAEMVAEEWCRLQCGSSAWRPWSTLAAP
jgi:hypothetical protein